MKKGKLYIVATPIGNLKDITIRAIETLKHIPFILAEDTRESKKLLNQYDIETPLVSYRDQNHDKMIGKIIEKLDMGLDLSLVSDNGTPLISDPGYKLVRELRNKGYEIIPIPGPSALTSAISIAGLPTDRFLFLGFLPKSDSKRIKIIKNSLKLECTLIIYESPNRIFDLLELIKGIDPALYVSAVRDMTKVREAAYTDSVIEVIKKLEKENLRENPHGEWVILVSAKI
jgi:16S rRNA (cytidine1402-2'-O)-methyltransferase